MAFCKKAKDEAVDVVVTTSNEFLIKFIVSFFLTFKLSSFSKKFISDVGCAATII